MEPHEHQPNDHSEPDDREADLPTQLPPRTEPADPEQPVPMSAEEYRRLLQRKIRRMYPWSLILFAAACASTFYVGGQQANGEFSPVSGATYAAGVMGILLAHELGHYFQALRYGVPASPPVAHAGAGSRQRLRAIDNASVEVIWAVRMTDRTVLPWTGPGHPGVSAQQHGIR